MKEIKVSNIKKDQKLIYYIKEKFPNLSSAVLHKALRNKDIKVNNKRINDSNYTLYNNDILSINYDENEIE